MASRNKSLLKELREDTLSEKLMEFTLADARLGRMSMPKQVDPNCLEECFMCPRFGVEQLKQVGKSKERAVDNFSWSPSQGSKAEKKLDSVNGWMKFMKQCDNSSRLPGLYQGSGRLMSMLPSDGCR